jgi:hypothetical protein
MFALTHFLNMVSDITCDEALIEVEGMRKILGVFWVPPHGQVHWPESGSRGMSIRQLVQFISRVPFDPGDGNRACSVTSVIVIETSKVSPDVISDKVVKLPERVPNAFGTCRTGDRFYDIFAIHGMHVLSGEAVMLRAIREPFFNTFFKRFSF